MSDVTVYEDSQFQGRSQQLGEGRYDWDQLANDTISSLRVPQGMKVTLFEDAHFRGKRKSFSSEAPYVGDDINDKTSSVIVERDAQRPVFPGKAKVLDYLRAIAGRGTVAGQHNKHTYEPMGATDIVRGITGRQPGLWSSDFLFGNDEVGSRPQMIEQARLQWNDGALVHLMYHACSPTGGEACSWDDIGGSRPAHLTDDQWRDLITPGGVLHAAWLGRLDTLARHLQVLRDAGVAPLFRPLHEMNHTVFWWSGRPGPNGAPRLWQITHDYLVQTKGLDNLIWVWDVQDFASLQDDVHAYYPGDDYFDVAALDVYDGGGYTSAKYDAIALAAQGKPIAIGECETLPTAELLAQQPDWAFFMLWPDFIEENRNALREVFASTQVITRDEMPGW